MVAPTRQHSRSANALVPPLQPPRAALGSSDSVVAVEAAAAFGLALASAPLVAEAALLRAAGGSGRSPLPTWPQRVGQPGAQPLEGQLPVPRLGSGVVDRHRHLGAESLREGRPLVCGEDRRACDVENHLRPSVRGVGVLPTWPAGRREAPRQLSGGDDKTTVHHQIAVAGHRSSSRSSSPRATVGFCGGREDDAWGSPTRSTWR